MITTDIVVPVFNEERRLAKRLPRLHAFLKRQPNLRWRIIIANNGSTDQTRAALLCATGDGIYCYSNFVSNSGVEGIIIQAPTNDSTASYYADNACYVYSNIITKDISLASGYGIRCDVSNSHVSNNVVSNSCIGLFVNGNDTTNLTTNLVFCNNTVTVAASASNNAWALYAAGRAVVNSSFSNNTCFLNMWNTTASNLNNTWTYNAGIRADSGSNNFFRSNSFNILYPTNSTGGTNYTNYYAIRVDGMNFDANFDNITNNLFVTNNISVTGGLGVYADGLSNALLVA